MYADSCSGSTCPEPPSPPDHGRMCDNNSLSPYEEGDTVTYCCDDYYNISGNQTITCTANNTWTDDASVECSGWFTKP